ncbi:hypothetical protein Kpol_262p3 [Vanderwaltozyma polyspora DSM 70294]|uniref:MADS-box domain-containing protein n=1 Tax=Vanderwaltozyma polyspora (strain ATCC 22028 / DSM 70294 / BCRC 21397 / CBS 2163 / NBRC 10782 / NRRL Y-8283 / UCD 57-17) TaxID=436907 RepID=A7TT07_VANPO|nr:uncharacterized protein Kpol_262p3 [Vanderwaltozyma polyspora DSM 70294]EDO14598.1 hypothetical protein Kpol_262p3 [Vanderwaltozyma polyspora DSM 70294]
MSDVDDIDDSTGNGSGVQQKERRKIEIKFIENKTRRHVTFSKRKHGIMKKAFELSVLTGTQVLLLVVSETGLVYTFSTPKFEPIVTQQEGRNLIQACLNAPDEEEEEENDDQQQPQQGQQQQQQQQQQQVQQQGQQGQQQVQQGQQSNGVLGDSQQDMKQDLKHHVMTNNNLIPQAGINQAAMNSIPNQNIAQHQGISLQHPNPQNYQNPSQSFLNQDQNAVYQQYFQETQQGQY